MDKTVDKAMRIRGSGLTHSLKRDPPEADRDFFGEADPPHGRGVMSGAKVGNGVAVGAGVAVAAGLCVATCACAPANKANKPTRTHTLRKAIPDRIRMLVAGCRS
jgi:hypothetical protein